jgi:hypothetical protein
MRNKGDICLHCCLVDTIKKYGKRHNGVYDCEIVAAAAEIIGDVISMQDPKEHSSMREFMNLCISKTIARNKDVGIGGLPLRLHS